MNEKTKNLPFRSIFAPIVFEACLIIPVLLTLLGFVSVTEAIKLRTVLIQNSLLFLLGAIVLFSFSLYGFLKGNKACDLKGVRQYKKAIIASIVVIILFEGFLLFVIPQIESITYGNDLVFQDDFNPLFFTIGVSLVIGLAGVIVLSIWFLIKNRLQKRK